MKTTIISLPIILACLALAAQGPSRPATGGGGLADQFRQLDRNGDGKLTREEVSQSLPFDQWDANRDGVVTRDEVQAFYTQPGGASPATSPTLRPASATPGALFRRTDIPGFTDIAEGTNGIALADLNHDGLADIVATYTEANRGLSNKGHRLRVFINQGNFRFQAHPITIRGSKLAGASFGAFPQIPNLADFNGDGLLDLFITRHSPFWAGKRWPGVEPIGNTLLLSDGAWDAFRDVSANLGLRNETAYNRQSSIADVSKDGWLDIAIGCDNVGDAIGGVSHSRLYIFRPEGLAFEAGRYEDNDGWLDLVVLDRHEAPTRPAYRAALFLNRGDGTFELTPTTFSGLDSTGISGEAADLNNDGLLDIVITCDPDNSGGGRAGVGRERYNDRVYVNTGAHSARANHWLRLRFSGVKEAELIGARIEVIADGRKQYRWIHSNHSYKSGGALDAHFGLGKETSAGVTVALLNGKSVTFADVNADQFLDLNLRTLAVSILEPPK